jgi:hypothetical protein
MTFRKRSLQAFLFAALLAIPVINGLSQEGADAAALGNVAQAILGCEGCSPGELFKAVKAANPGSEAIVSMRELNKALADGKMPADVANRKADIIAKQKSAQQAVRERVLNIRQKVFTQYCAANPEKARSLYGYGDIGSWSTSTDPDASMDIDWTVFGVDPDVTAELRDMYNQELITSLAGEETQLTLKDFDIIATAEGHEAEAHVFETEGGIDWAKRNMKRVTLVNPDGSPMFRNPDGSPRSINLETKIVLGYNPDGSAITVDRLTGDPIGELAMAEHMATFRKTATENGDYDKLFDEKGFLKSQVFVELAPDVKETRSGIADEMWQKYKDILSDFGVDYYRTRAETAPGGCLDMAKHLQEEALSKNYEPKSKLKKTLKYVSRADNISRGAPGVLKLLASDPILGDPAYQSVVELARQVMRSNDAQVQQILKEKFGDMPDAGLQELGNKARRSILRMAEVSYQVEMDRIILEMPDAGARQAALDKLAADMKIIAEEGGEYTELAHSAIEHISKMTEANESGAIEEIRKNYNSLEKIRQADMGIIKHTTEYLKQTELGNKMLEMGGKLLEIGQIQITPAAEPKFQSSAVEFVGEMVDTARAKSIKIVEMAGSAMMWASVIDNVRNAKSDAELAIALGKTLAENTFFGMVMTTAYAGVIKGDNDALGKAIMYMLVPETALPVLVESLGNTAINIGSETLFDAQMDKIYEATKFNNDGKISDFSGLGMDGPSGAKYFVDTMCDGAPEEVAQDIISKSKATETGAGANEIAIKAISKVIKSTVENGNPLILKDDGGVMKTTAGIRKVTEDIKDCAKVWNIEIALSASSENDLPSGLDIGQTRALVKLMGQREKIRGEARKALENALVRTFEERRRAEQSLDEGKAKDEYAALLKIFEQLGISKEGSAALETEGAPYNLITNWLTSTKEKQITAIKAVQKFKDVYSIVLQYRGKTESSAKTIMGDDYEPTPRALTGSLPLTASPEFDAQIARSNLAEAAKAGESTYKDLETMKTSKLDGSYDESVVKTLYDLRFKIAYWNAMMQAAGDAQQLHWAIEIFDKQALYNKHSEAAGKISELRKQETAVLDEFKKHYQLDGDFIVELSGPEEIQSGQEAKLACSIKIRKAGVSEATPVPDDFASQMHYAWTSGKTALGEDAIPVRSYKLDTVGSHVFTVTARRSIIKAGKEELVAIGLPAKWTVKVIPSLGITVSIEGNASALLNEEVPLNANIKVQKQPAPELKYSWTEGKNTLGESQTASFKSKVEGTFTIKLKVAALVGKDWQTVDEPVHKIKITKSKAVDMALDGPGKAKPDEKVQLKATVTAADKALLPTLRTVWREGTTALGEGASVSFSSREEKAHKITVIVYGKADGLEEEMARADYEITIAKEETKIGSIAADLVGMRSDVVQGGSVEVYAANFRDTSGGKIPAGVKLKVVWWCNTGGTFNPKETMESGKASFVVSAAPLTTIAIRGQIFAEKDGKFAPVGSTGDGAFTVSKNQMSVNLEATKTTLKPGEVADILATVTSYGLKPPYKYVWTGEHAGGGADGSKVSFASRQNGPHVLSVEATDSEGVKGTASITLTVLGVTATLEGLSGEVIYGSKVPISLKVEGIDKIQEAFNPKDSSKEPPQEWVLTAIEREDKKASGPTGYEVYETSEHSDTSFRGWFHHPNSPIDVTASWGMPPTRVKPGTTLQIPWSVNYKHTGQGMDGAGILYTYAEGGSQNLNDSNYWHATYNEGKDSLSGTFKHLFPEGIPGKTLKVIFTAKAEYEADGSVDFAHQTRTFVYTFAGENAIEVNSPPNIIWQSEPGITFIPSTSQDYKTIATFDRMGKIKMWAEIQIQKDGVYQTIGETDQKEVVVKPPKFLISYEPAEGQGKVGQEIKATVKTDPLVEAGLIEYVWESPASSNRMQHEMNASVIGFKLSDPKPFQLKATARVPKWLDTIDDLTGSYTASPYVVKAQVAGAIGPKPQVWKEGVGLVNIEKGSYASDETVEVKATIEGDPAPTDVRWKWTANDGTTIVGGEISAEARASRHETGTAEMTVEAKDKNGTFLGKATANFSVTVSADALKKAKEKANPLTVALSADKTSMKLDDNVRLTATAKGGKPPYAYSWTGEAKGQGTSASWKADESGSQEFSVTVRDADGKTATAKASVSVQGAFAADLRSDKNKLLTGEVASLTVSAGGGKQPYAYQWLGKGVAGQGTSAKLTPSEPGDIEVSVVITDARKRSVTQNVMISVEAVKPALEGVPEKSAFGSKIQAKVSFRQASASTAGQYNVIWRSTPELSIAASGPVGTITFSTIGNISIWAEVTSQGGKLLGKTDPKTVAVAAPTFDLKFENQGKDVVARLTANPSVDQSFIEVKWLSPANARTGSDALSMTFTPVGTLATDILATIKVKGTSVQIQEIKMHYQGGGDNSKKPPSNDKDKASNKGEATPAGESNADDLAKSLSTAETLAASGDIEQAISIVDKASGANSPAAIATSKKVAGYAAASAMNSVNDLDFVKAIGRLEAAVRLDPSNATAKSKLDQARTWEQGWNKSQDLRNQMSALAADKRLPSAEKTLQDIRSLILPIQSNKATAWIKQVDDSLVGPRTEYRNWMNSLRTQIQQLISQNAFENALPLVREGLQRELFTSDDKQFRNWQSRCEQKIKQNQTANPETAGTDAPTTQPPAGNKKQGGFLGGLTNAINKIDGVLNAAKLPTGSETSGTSGSSSPSAPTKPTVVLDNGNTGGCSYTDTAVFTLNHLVSVTQLLIWYNWEANESSVSYSLTDNSGYVLRNNVFVRGECDPYQKSWCNGADEPGLYLPVGRYMVKLARGRMCQNSGSGGNGMVKVVTGGLLVKPNGASETATSNKPDRVQQPSTPTVVSDNGNTGGCSYTDRSTFKLNKPVGVSQLVIWYNWEANEASVSYSLTDNSGYVLRNNAFVRGECDPYQKSWCNGADETNIDLSPGNYTVILTKGRMCQNSGSGGNGMVKVVTGGLLIQPSGAPKTTQATTGAKPADKPTAVSNASIPAPAEADLKPRADSTSRMITVIFQNDARENVHIFPEGSSFDPSNRLSPGETRTANVKMPSNGRIKFISGRGGVVISTTLWNGDPDDLNRIPKVIFTDEETLIVTTVLQ